MTLLANRLIVIFLINIIWLFICCSKKEDKKLFEEVPSSVSHIDFDNKVLPTFDLNILDYNYFYNGGGVAAADFNNDGLTDLYFTGNKVPSKLYLNKGNFSFEDITARARLTTTGWATGIAVADINNDGLQDMFVSYAGHPEASKRVHQLFINKGINKKGLPSFNDEAAAYGLADTSYTTQSVFFDFDKDGDLDLLLANHYQDLTNPNYPLPILSDGKSSSNNKLFRNDNGHFTEISKKAGILLEGYSLGVVISDINNDGWPDIYFPQDFTYDDALYINNTDGTFKESIRQYVNHTSRFSMGCDIADFNNDTYPDIFTADMMPADNERQKIMNIAMNNDRFNLTLSLGYLPQYARNMLQLNNGPGPGGNYSFSEIGQLAGVYKTDWSWSTLFADLDNDGWKDLFITNGIPKDITNNDFVSYRAQKNINSADLKAIKNDLLKQIEALEPVDKPNYVFKNNKDLTFTDKGSDWGLAVKGMSNGAVYVDLDNDGDLDIVTNNMNATAGVFKNRSNELYKNSYVKIKLKGKHAIGAKVYLKNAGGTQFLENNPVRGFQSSQDPVLHFGLGKDSLINEVKVVWLDGKVEVREQIKANQVLLFDYNNSKSVINSAPKSPASLPLFTEVTQGSGFDFTHYQNPFEDFNLEPLLPHRFSRNGPYVCVGDVDKNGLEDVWIGGAAKISGKLFLQQPNNKFIDKDMPDPGYEDMGGVFFDADKDNDLDLYVVSGGNAYNPFTATYQDRLYINDGKGNFKIATDALPQTYASGSVVLTQDFDKDGDLDLFVGGRVSPTQYPLPPQSYMLQNNGEGKFEDVTAQVCPELGNIGMVTSAVWQDYNKDGNIDLIIAGECMPVTIFKNNKGNFTKLANSTLESSSGWWFSLTSADMDNDGDVDFIAGNLGSNNRFGVTPNTPLTVYGKDFDGNGTIKPILSYYLNNTKYTIADRDQITSVMPSIKKKFDTYGKFGKADFEDIFTKDDLSEATKLTVSNLKSVYIENKGNDTFQIHDLPIRAQFSAIQSIIASDFDKDGLKDLLIAGNFYSPDFMTGRYDASIGLFLKGNGKGKFIPISSAESGIHIKGDARALTTLKIEDRSVILAAINQGKFQLFKANY